MNELIAERLKRPKLHLRWFDIKTLTVKCVPFLLSCVGWCVFDKNCIGAVPPPSLMVFLCLACVEVDGAIPREDGSHHSGPMACQVASLPDAPAHICLEHTQVAEPGMCFVLELVRYCGKANLLLLA